MAESNSGGVPPEPNGNPSRAFINLSRAFIESAGRRGVDPNGLGERICQVAVDVDREAAFLFPEWKTATTEEQLRFISGAIRARIDLELPERERE